MLCTYATVLGSTILSTIFWTMYRKTFDVVVSLHIMLCLKSNCVYINQNNDSIVACQHLLNLCVLASYDRSSDACDDSIQLAMSKLAIV